MYERNKPLFLELQQHELDGAALYLQIAQFSKKDSERETLKRISAEEYDHASAFEKYTKTKLKPNALRVGFYTFLSRVLGYTFVIKYLELGEERTIAAYKANIEIIPEINEMLEDEQRHEEELLEILDEEHLRYVGDMVLGMNDALVELTGALAGYSLAMRHTGLIAMAGLITGASATLSMAASGYLSSREAGENNPAKSALYTGAAYLITVALLILPYLVFNKEQYMAALGTTLITALAIIAAFNFYIAIAKGRSFRRGFFTMAGISLGVAAISFAIGLIVKKVLGIDI
ncbi:MAG: VIT family protein [Firmicutes bacterium ADurb.Bin356]|nr:MAG: VIT family protein [Firmicutes bacterium ADurb.Bin356]